jgi:hypothetical protein
MKKASLILLILFFILPIIRADTIQVGYKGITINNVITNINDFPDYIFISTCELGNIGNIDIITRDGKIPPYYKFCKVSVYAIKESYFDKSFVEDVRKTTTNSSEFSNDFNKYINSENVKEVITNIQSYETTPIVNPKDSITNYYTVDLNQIKEKPDNVSLEKNDLFYVYIIISLIALIAIILIIIKKVRE